VAATTACGGAADSAGSRPGAVAASRPGAVAASASPQRGPASRPAGSPARAGRPTPDRTTSSRTTAPANRPARTTAPAPAPVPACAARNLTASEGSTGLPASGESGWFATPILLRNRSGSTCRLRGWPGLTFYGDDTIVGCAEGDSSPSCGKPLSTSGTRPFSVTRSAVPHLPDMALSPGRTTSFTLVWQGSYSCDRLVDGPYGIDVRVPGDSHPLTLLPAVPISPCEGHLQVTPFGVAG
jgi:hypothetical protein